MSNRQGSITEIFWVISEIQNLAKDFDNVNIKYAHRSYNAITHSLTKLAIEKCETLVRMIIPLKTYVPSILFELNELFSFQKKNWTFPHLINC